MSYKDGLCLELLASSKSCSFAWDLPKVLLRALGVVWGSSLWEQFLLFALFSIRNETKFNTKNLWENWNMMKQFRWICLWAQQNNRVSKLFVSNIKEHIADMQWVLTKNLTDVAKLECNDITLQFSEAVVVYNSLDLSLELWQACYRCTMKAVHASPCIPQFGHRNTEFHEDWFCVKKLRRSRNINWISISKRETFCGVCLLAKSETNPARLYCELVYTLAQPRLFSPR